MGEELTSAAGSFRNLGAHASSFHTWVHMQCRTDWLGSAEVLELTRLGQGVSLSAPKMSSDAVH